MAAEYTDRSTTTADNIISLLAGWMVFNGSFNIERLLKRKGKE